MGFGNTSLFLKVAFILLIIALIIQILGCALPYWYSFESSGTTTYGGLWKTCVKQSSTICLSFSNVKGWFDAVRALEIMGVLLIAVALILTIIVMFVKDMKVLKLVAWILSFVSCAFILIGICVYGSKIDAFSDHLSGAFAITIIAGIICLVAGIFGLIDWMGKGSPS